MLARMLSCALPLARPALALPLRLPLAALHLACPARGMATTGEGKVGRAKAAADKQLKAAKAASSKAKQAEARLRARVEAQAKKLKERERRQAKRQRDREARQAKLERLQRQRQQRREKAEEAKQRRAGQKEKEAKRRQAKKDKEKKRAESRAKRLAALKARIEKTAQARFKREQEMYERHPNKLRRDPSLPRAPITPYARFYKERHNAVRQSVKEQQPAASGEDARKQAMQLTVATMRRLAEEWRSMSDSAKSRYTEAHARERAEYDKKRAEIEKNAPPKKPAGAYISFFLAHQPEVRRANPGAPLVTLAAKVAEKYRALSDEEKQAIQSKVHAEQEAWARDMEAWTAKHPERAQQLQEMKQRSRRPSLQRIRKEVKQTLEEEYERKHGQDKKKEDSDQTSA